MVQKGYSAKEIADVLGESDKERKRREMRMKVTETVNAHRLKEMENRALRVEMAARRRKNGFDRVEPPLRDGIPLSTEEFTTYLRDEVQEQEDAIF
jgi:hypothetical protein